MLFDICFPNFWLDVYVLSQCLQSNFPMSTIWAGLCCVRYLLCVNVFGHVSQLNILNAVFLFSLCHTLIGVSANYLSVCKHSHTCHTHICFPCEFSCSLQAHPLPHPCHKRSTFQLCAHIKCASSKYMLCGTFCHRCYRWTRFLRVFSVVLFEAKWIVESFSTIGTLILNVQCSKSGS